jgi:hypothetical protein
MDEDAYICRDRHGGAGGALEDDGEMKHQPFQWFAETYEDWMKDPGLTLMTSKMMDDGAKTYKATVDAYFENRVVFTDYRNSQYDSWAFVHPSTLTAGEWRYTMFDDHGFIGHEDNFITEFDAYYEMHDRHYRIIDRGALERTMKGKDWPKGGMMPKPSWMGAFEPYPEQFFGGRTAGTFDAPGFHTATEIETTYPYAQLKINTSSDIEDLKKGLPDYPVIVELDMDGLVPLVDYDAMAMRGSVDTLIGEIESEMGLRWGPPAKSPMEALRSICDGDMYYEETIPDSRENGISITGLFYLSVVSPSDIAYRLRDILEEYSDPDHSLICWIGEGIPDSILIEIQGQRRYETRVEGDRILAVHYMNPYVHYTLSESPDEEYMDFIEQAELLGYSILRDEDLYDRYNPTIITEVWRRRTIKNPEFHGTSYCNLIGAAPELMHRLPIPPPPFIHHESCRR